MPRSLQRLQCQDLSKLGWMQDLTRGVLKICRLKWEKAEQHNAETVLEKKAEPARADEQQVQFDHDEDELKIVPAFVVNQDENTDSDKIETAVPQNESGSLEMVAERAKAEKKRISAGRVFATLFHMLSIMIVAIMPHGFSLQNMTLVGIDIFCALILPVFVWKADKKKSTKRILLNSFLCYIAVILVVLAVQKKMNMYIGIGCIWTFIVLNIIF